MKPIKKGYIINMNRIDEGYCFCEYSTSADSLGKAKVCLLQDAHDSGMTLSNGEDITYLNIPVVRDKQLDVYEFEGKQLTKRAIEQLQIKRERIAALDSILNDDSIKYCYIMKRGEYYRPNSCGYTSYKYRAGVYSKEEAVSDAKRCDELRIIPINIQEHNEMVNKEIDNLKMLLIKSVAK